MDSAAIRFYPSGSGIDRTWSDVDTNIEGKLGEGDSQPQHPHTRRVLNRMSIFRTSSGTDDPSLAPEQNITLFALRLAIIEKIASGLGALSFVWATTIILGGFAANINTTDFTVVAIILTTEGTRIFSRSRELEWQHLAAKSTRSTSNKSLQHLESARFTQTSARSTCGNSSTRATPNEETRPGRLSRADSSIEIHESLKIMEPSTSNDGKTRSTSSRGCFPWSISRTTKQHGENSKQMAMKHVSQPVGDLEEGSGNTMSFAQGIPKGLVSESSSSMGVVGDRRISATGNGSHCIDIPNDASKDLQRPLGSMSANLRSVTTMCTDEINVCRPKMPQHVKRTWSSDLVPVLPGGVSKFLSNRSVSAILFWVQLSSAFICLALACWRLSQQRFDPPNITSNERPVNLYMSINLFYVLALLEAFMFLAERGYWEYKMNYQNLILEANNKAGLGVIGEEIMRQFYCEVYKTCIEGSVFDGLEMDLVDFSLTLLQSDNTFEQFGGLRVLRKIVDRYDSFSADALRRIGTTPGVIERLVEMLSWRGPHHGDILEEAAALVCRAVRYSKNCVRIAAVPGSMEMIVSLVKSSERDRVATSVIDRSLMDTLPSTTHNVMALRLDGLRILIAQARDPANLVKIGEARGLVPALVSLITIRDVELFKRMDGEELKTFKKVLRLLAILVAARNAPGKILRPTVARVVSCIASMRDILEFGDSHPQLQWIAIETLTNLALDDEIRQAIGGTGGVIRNLLTLYIPDLSRQQRAFFDTGVIRKVQQTVSKRAGEALNFLAIQNRKNCSRMMELKLNGHRTFIPALINLLGDHKEQTVCAAKILRSLMEHANDAQQREISVCTPLLMKLMVRASNPRILEAVIGLAPRVVDYLDDAEYNEMMEVVDRAPLIRNLLRNLDSNARTFTRSPRIRRYSIECILAFIRRDYIFLDKFNEEGMLEDKLLNTLDSISDVENFLTFSGAEGLTRYTVPMEDLIHRTLQDLRYLTDRRRQRYH